MKWLYISYTDDFEFARCEPELPYDTQVVEWQKLRKAEPRRYWRQGLAYGRLDTAVESLIVAEDSEPPRCMSFGEFERAFFAQGSDVADGFASVMDIFLGFDPRTRPFLWRILVAQAHLCMAIIRAGEIGRDMSPDEFRPLRLLAGAEKTPYDWREPNESVSEHEVFQPFSVAKKYFEDHLAHLLAGEETDDRS